MEDQQRQGNGQQPLVGQRGIWAQLMNKYATTSQNYPLGMTSGCLPGSDPARGTVAGGDETNPQSTLAWHPAKAEAPSKQQLPSANSTTTSAAEFVLDANVMRAIMATTADDGRPQTMSVKAAAVCHDDPDDDYKMTARPRGFCLIVNNVNFEHELFPTRRGSDQDAYRFDQLFTQLGFLTIMARNLTADQMRDKFRELSAACRPEHDALFVFILSHGSDSGIYGTDGFEVYLENDIISCFDNRNCRQMIGKPKVFVIQACRGGAQDCGGGDTIDAVASNAANHANGAWNSVPNVAENGTKNKVPTSWLPSSVVVTSNPEQVVDSVDREHHPIRTDILLVFSCLAGFVSVRNETAGSWLGVALAYFLMTHAHERDLLKVLNLVTGDIIQRRSAMGHSQSIEVKLLGWTKNLYFNPGIFR